MPHSLTTFRWSGGRLSSHALSPARTLPNAVQAASAADTTATTAPFTLPGQHRSSLGR